MSDTGNTGSDEDAPPTTSAGGTERPEGAIPKAKAPTQPVRTAVASVTLSPRVEPHHHVMARQGAVVPTVYDTETPYWGWGGARRSLDLEMGAAREIAEIRSQLEHATTLLTALVSDDTERGDEATRVLLQSQGLPLPERLATRGAAALAAAAAGGAGQVAPVGAPIDGAAAGDGMGVPRHPPTLQLLEDSAKPAGSI